MASVGRIEPYDGNCDLEAYLERLELYFIANNVGAISGDDNEAARRLADRKKVATLLTLVGSETYLLLKSLLSPQLPSEFTFDEITSKLINHLKPRRLTVAERFKFHQRNQNDGEDVAKFAAELRRLASTCNFGDFLTEALRDQFVCGIRNGNTQRKLLSEDRSFEQAMQIALADEAADAEAKQLHSHGNSGASGSIVGAVGVKTKAYSNKSSAYKRTENPKMQTNRKCYRCNGSHSHQTCKFKDAICHFCKKAGHIAAACRKKQSTLSETHVVNTTPIEKEEYSLYNVDNKSSTQQQPIKVQVKMNGKDISMVLDTGAGVSIINELTMRTVITDNPTKLQPADHMKLTSYTGQTIPVLGLLNVTTQYKGQSAQVPIVVVAGEMQNLLGRNLLTEFKLDWGEIMLVRNRDPVHAQLMEEVPDVFKEGLGELKGMKVNIHVKDDAIPRFHKARPVPYAMKQKVEDELNRLQESGIIEPIQFSEWAAPIVPVLKSNGQIRICGDYKVTINKGVVEDKYPLPRVNDLYASLTGGETFSKLDMSQAYLQLKLDEGSRDYVTINTHKGLFRYTRLPYGLSVAPSIFQRTLECVLAGIPHVCIFLDDILVTGKTQSEHVANLRLVLKRLDEAGLKLNNEKCQFFNASVVYLGHKIDRDGLHPTDEKVRAIQDAPHPTNVKELRAWLGLLNYYGRFLCNLSTTLAPLHVLLRKETKWQWGKDQSEAFRAAKNLLQSDSLLVHFDQDKPILLACDASPYGVGAVLSHQMPDGSERPIAYASRSLSPAERNYSQLDKEGLSLVFGVTKFHQYLHGMTFVLITDHRPLIGLFNEQRPVPQQASSRLQRWALTLAGYDYVIRHRSGEAHENCDALSRLPLPTESTKTPAPAEYVQLIQMLDDSPITSGDIRNWTQRDPVLSRVQRYVLTGWPESDQTTQQFHRVRQELSIHEGCVMRGARVVVPTPGQATMLKLLHSSHNGVVKMKALARSYIWWPGIDQQIENIAQHCGQCEENARQPTRAPLRPWLFPQRPWSRVHVDYAGPTEGKMILVVVDAYSKWIEAKVVHSATTQVTIEQLRGLFATHGLPETIVSDNGTCFTSAEFKQFVTRNNIQHITSPAYHPSSNGLAERAVQLVKRGLAKLKDGSMETRLARYLMTYRVTPHSTTGTSPSELLMGRKLRTLLDAVHPSISGTVHRKQEKMAENYNKKSKVRCFHPGDKIYVKSHTQSAPKWIPAVLRERSNDVMISETEDGRVLRRHRDHVRRRHADSLDIQEGVSQDIPAAILEPSEPGETVTGAPSTDEEPSSLRRSERLRKAPDKLNL